jgi:hypothetical protein
MLPLYARNWLKTLYIVCVRTDVLAANRGRVVAAITIHSYYQFWMCPYGYQNALPTDYAEMVNLYSYIPWFYFH